MHVGISNFEGVGTVLKMYGPGKECRGDLPLNTNGNILSSLLNKGKQHQPNCRNDPLFPESLYASGPGPSGVPISPHVSAIHGKMPPNTMQTARSCPEAYLRPEYRVMPPRLIPVGPSQFRTPTSAVTHTISSPVMAGQQHPYVTDDVKPLIKHYDHETKTMVRQGVIDHESHYVNPDCNKMIPQTDRESGRNAIEQCLLDNQLRNSPVRSVQRDSVESMETQNFPMPASTREVLTPDKTDTDSGVFTDSEQDEPMDLSCRRNSTPVSESSSCPSTPEPAVPQGNQRNFSIAIADTQYLRELLSRSDSSDEFATSPPSKSSARTHCTKVTLAKKNLLPVSARVSDWLMKIVQFAESIPEFKNLTQNDKVTLLLSSWSRVLLLYMAENNFHFVVSPDTKEGSSESITPLPPCVPTLKSVEMILNLIRKYQSLNLDAKEYLMLRIAVLFQCDAGFLEKPEIVENVRHQVQECLQQHVQVTRSDDVMRYARLLLSLPVLYSIDDKMMENLFCKHITGDTDVTVLLKEMLKSL